MDTMSKALKFNKKMDIVIAVLSSIFAAWHLVVDWGKLDLWDFGYVIFAVISILLVFVEWPLYVGRTVLKTFIKKR